jgi:hypothetical protein
MAEVDRTCSILPNNSGGLNGPATLCLKEWILLSCTGAPIVLGKVRNFLARKQSLASVTFGSRVCENADNFDSVELPSSE